MAKGTEPLWVFGYGSLMWRPGFAYVARSNARLNGYRRRACVLSTTHRGTPERPGVVMGLDRGGACRGIAYQVAPARAAEVEDYLDARELIYTGYKSVRVPVRLTDGDIVTALTYVVIQADHEYIGHLDDDRIARLMAQGRGSAGDCLDYMVATAAGLAEMGVRDSRFQTQIRAAHDHRAAGIDGERGPVFHPLR